MIGQSLWLPQRACIRSACAGRVGMPADGPPRITSMITLGISAALARPMPSSFSEKPGPLVAVIAFTPPADAPITAAIAAISSSI
jgi:hypothetical protein